MIEITKKECMNGIIGNKPKLLIYTTIISILATIQIWIRSSSIWWLIFCIITFGALIILVFLVTRKRIKSILRNNNFYIVEDVFINVCEQNATVNKLIRLRPLRHIPKYDYAVKFSQSGIQDVLLFSKEEPKEIEPDYSTVFYSKPGDKVFLLIYETPENKCILRCFNAKYYKILEDDFNYIDGKYYPK